MSEIGEVAGVNVYLSPKQYKEYKGTLNKQIEELQQQLQQKENIIKEVREYIEWLRKEHHKTENVGYTKAVYNTNELLVILHKLEGE